MTFRLRLIVAATVAVAIAVVVAAVVVYFPARNTLLASLDNQLNNRATAALSQPDVPIAQSDLFGDSVQFWPDGIHTPGVTLPVDARVRAVAQGASRPFFTDVTLHGIAQRELVTKAPVGTLIQATAPLFPGQAFPQQTTTTPLAQDNAFQLATPLTGVNQQIGNLQLALILVALAGVVLAVLLGWLVGRTALRPLDALTESVEDLASTTDGSRRLDPGGPDELGRLRRSFNHLLGALDASREAQRQLVLDAGHELRTPLTSLRTNLEVLRRVDELDPSDREVLVSDVLAQLGELTTLVGNLSELARGDHRPEEARRYRLDLVLEESVTLAQTHGRARGVHFELHAAPTWASGHPDRVARALGNLLDNALKWSPDQGAVVVTCANGVVTVRDHGPGITPEDLPHVFDRFYRAPAARRLPGSGLGLAIVSQVAIAEGGSVDILPTPPGDGACFRFQLPPVAPPPPPRLSGPPGVDPVGDEGLGDGEASIGSHRPDPNEHATRPL